MKSNKEVFSENYPLYQTNSNLISDIEFNHVFTLIPKSAPVIIRKCSRCEKNRFASGNKFRVNANKKIIDVWLIYKCESCENTLNVSILSRKSIINVNKTLLEGFHNNDPDLAWRYAFDPAYIENGTEVDWAIDFEIDHRKTIPGVGLNSDWDEFSSLLIQSHFFLKIPSSLVLRKVLNISRSQLDKMQASGNIETNIPRKAVNSKKTYWLWMCNKDKKTTQYSRQLVRYHFCF